MKRIKRHKDITISEINVLIDAQNELQNMIETSARAFSIVRHWYYVIKNSVKQGKLAIVPDQIETMWAEYRKNEIIY